MTARAAADGVYGFAYHSYPLVTAYLEQWHPGSPQERLLEELNSPPVLEFMRAITGIGEIVKMDGQATLYAPGHFLRPHNDEESERGRRVAYVLNLTVGEWQPHWGGYLNFFSEDWDIEQAFRPRFNCLNLFRVPQWHSVGEVSAAAPLARYAVTGWARDR
jgi:Rps23 Pro-64 3,4-dihydroxylase Tpa1-like proline 4-hydroxylase